MIDRLFKSFAFVMALTLALALPATAYAEDDIAENDPGSQTMATSVDGSGENLVDPTQRADNTFIYDTAIEDALGEPSLHEGRIVQLTGEAIGDMVLADPAGEYCWVTLESMVDGSDSNISVYMTAEQAKQIDHFGRYGVVGTTLQVRGTFHQACSQHEGLIDVHADSVSVVARGAEHPDTLNLNNFSLGFLLIAIGAVLLAAFHFARERLR